MPLLYRRSLRFVLKLVFVLALVATGGGHASGSEVQVGDIWQEFYHGAPGTFAEGCVITRNCIPSPNNNTEFAEEAPWTFTAPPEGATLIVTDVGNWGGRFEVFDGLTSLGLTYQSEDQPGGCHSDPELCIENPNSGTGYFMMQEGDHEVSILAANGSNGGAGYFRVDPGLYCEVETVTTSIGDFSEVSWEFGTVFPSQLHVGLVVLGNWLPAFSVPLPPLHPTTTLGAITLPTYPVVSIYLVSAIVGPNGIECYDVRGFEP